MEGEVEVGVEGVEVVGEGVEEEGVKVEGVCKDQPHPDKTLAPLRGCNPRSKGAVRTMMAQS